MFCVWWVGKGKREVLFHKFIHCYRYYSSLRAFRVKKSALPFGNFCVLSVSKC